MSPAQIADGYLLSVKEANKSGNFQLVENTPAGTIAIQRASSSSQLSWQKPKGIEAGWYRVSFLATSYFQVISETYNENEPFIITIKGSDDSKTGADSSYAFKDQDAKHVLLHSLPQHLLDPTPVQTWHSCQPVWIGENSRIELEVRRPLLIVGDIRLEPTTKETDQVHLTLAGDVPFNMFTDEKPVGFRYGLQNFSSRGIQGKLRFILKDALDGSEQTQTRPLEIGANTNISEKVAWTPKYGAYLITGELVNDSGEVLCRQNRNFTYSPFIDVKKLPDDWPIGFHIDLGQPEAVPPVGIKWIRLWGAWKEMEPAPGKYDWSLMDRHVQLAKKGGFRLLWVFHHVPEWSLPENVLNRPRAFANYPPANIDRLRPFLHAFWQRYAGAGVIGAVEIDNEPNASAGWTPEEYGQEARAVYDVTHADAKGVKVIGISESGGIHMDYMEKALAAGLNTNMDIASLHLYEIANPVGEQSIELKTRLFLQKLQEHGLGKMPVWNTESGCPMQLRQDGVIVPMEELNRQITQRPEFDASRPWRVGQEWRAPSELLGAAWMVRASYQQFVMGVKNNFIFQWNGSPHFSWVYDWKDGGNVMPKIIVVATGVMSKMLLEYGPHPAINQPKIEKVGDWLVFAHRYEGPKGRMTIVYIHPAKTYAGSGDKVAALANGDHDLKTASSENVLSPWLRTQEPKPVSVTIPVNPDSKQVIVTDMFDRKPSTVPVVNGSVEMDASEIPQYVLEKNNDAGPAD